MDGTSSIEEIAAIVGTSANVVQEIIAVLLKEDLVYF
jgi:hypothetical protein